MRGTPSSVRYKSSRWEQYGIETIVKTITYLVSLLAFFSVFREVDRFFSSVFLILFLVSVYLEYKKRFYPPRWLLNAISLAVIILAYLRFSLGELVTQIMGTLLILLAIKLIEDKKFRDYMQIYAITLFLLAGLGLLSLDITFLVYLILLVFLLTIATVLLTFYTEDPSMELDRGSIAKIILKSLYIPLLAIPLSVVMFAILPRTQFPLFQFMNRAEKAKTGFTDNVRLGVVSDIQEDSSAILRVTMERVEDSALYWRGIVLDRFDGISWKSSQKRGNPGRTDRSGERRGKTVRQLIFLEPYENRYLFALDKPLHIFHRRAMKLDDLTFIASGYIDKRIRYEAISVISDTIREESIDEKRYLQVPDSISPEIRRLVGEVALYREPYANAQSILSCLRDGSYRYSLKNLPVTASPLDDFLFKVKSGNCEYFASSFAVMLRIAGIPSRVVGGYRGGYYNDVGGYYLVPQKNAHVWVEAYLEGEGWVRLDPTPGGMEGFTSPLKGNLYFRLQLLLDTVNYYYHAFVINYNFEKQVSILHTMKGTFSRPNLKLTFSKIGDAAPALLVIPLVASVVAIMVCYRRRPPVEKRLISAFDRKLTRYGYTRGRTQGLEEFLEGIGDDTIRKSANEFVVEFERLYFRDKEFTSADTIRLKGLIKSI